MSLKIGDYDAIRWMARPPKDGGDPWVRAELLAMRGEGYKIGNAPEEASAAAVVVALMRLQQKNARLRTRIDDAPVWENKDLVRALEAVAAQQEGLR